MTRVILSRIAAAACLPAVLIGCTKRGDFGNDAAIYQTRNETAVLSPGTQAVRIGEGGAAFPACAAKGVMNNLARSGLSYLPLRAAPFEEAGEVARLREGAPVFLCARSLDQRWQGVVLPPADAPDGDCGVAAPIDAPRDYAGPCRTGWVPASFVRAIGE